jgi:hypothetical protein
MTKSGPRGVPGPRSCGNQSDLEERTVRNFVPGSPVGASGALLPYAPKTCRQRS